MVPMTQVTKEEYTNHIEVMQQALDALNELWYSNTTSIANQKFKLATEALAATIAQYKHQEFIDSFNMTDDLDDKMFMQIEHWARQSYRRYRTSVRGQMISRYDCYDSHLVWATLKWVKENTPKQEPVGYFTRNDFDMLEQVTGTAGKPLYEAPQPQPKQEPMTPREIAAFVGTHEFGPDQRKWFRLGEASVRSAPQPQREWQGLSAIDVLDMIPEAIPAKYDGILIELARTIESKLREKNT